MVFNIQIMEKYCIRMTFWHPYAQHLISPELYTHVWTTSWLFLDFCFTLIYTNMFYFQPLESIESR